MGRLQNLSLNNVTNESPFHFSYNNQSPDHFSFFPNERSTPPPSYTECVASNPIVNQDKLIETTINNPNLYKENKTSLFCKEYELVHQLENQQKHVERLSKNNVLDKSRHFGNLPENLKTNVSLEMI